MLPVASTTRATSRPVLRSRPTTLPNSPDNWPNPPVAEKRAETLRSRALLASGAPRLGSTGSGRAARCVSGTAAGSIVTYGLGDAAYWIEKLLLVLFVLITVPITAPMTITPTLLLDSFNHLKKTAGAGVEMR